VRWLRANDGDVVPSDVVYLKVSFDVNPQLCERLHIEQLPFFSLYKGARGRIAAFAATRGTFQRLRGTVESPIEF
jgi:hypothetical protein